MARKGPKLAIRRSLRDRWSWDVVLLDAKGRVLKRLVTETTWATATSILTLAEAGQWEVPQ